MKTLCEINKLIESGEITSFAQKAPQDVHSMDQGKYHGALTMTNTPTTTEPFYYQVFKLGDKDRQIIAHGMQTGRTFQLIQQNGTWGAWKETDGRSAYQIWLDEGNTGNKAAFLASLRGPKGKDGDSFADLAGNPHLWATPDEVMKSVVQHKFIDPKALQRNNLMGKGDGYKPYSIPDKANLNDYLHVGMYHQGASANTTHGSNYPEKLAGMLVVMDDGGFVYQTYYIYGPANRQYSRTKYNNQWTTWRRIDERFDPSAGLTYINNPSASHFNALVIGQSMFAHGSGVPTSVYVHCIGNKDTGGGKGFIATEYSTGRLWVGSAPSGGVPHWVQYGAMTLSGTTLTITL